jgi:dihydropteroate synthase
MALKEEDLAQLGRVYRARDVSFPLRNRPLIMGILNVTPDSFSDGGTSAQVADAVRHAEGMICEGVDIIDVGGESTRPGFLPVSPEDELARVIPAIEAIRRVSGVPISVDTTKASVARCALEAGAHIVNDIWGFQRNPDLARAAADFGAGVVLMHNRENVDGGIDIMADVIGFLQNSVDLALSAGIPLSNISVDPGVGFGKTPEQNAEVIRRLEDLNTLGLPILLGASRKGFIGRLSGVAEPGKRIAGTLAAHIAGALHGADIIRAHDVARHHEAFSVLAAVRRPSS